MGCGVVPGRWPGGGGGGRLYLEGGQVRVVEGGCTWKVARWGWWREVVPGRWPGEGGGGRLYLEGGQVRVVEGGRTWKVAR